VERLVDERGMTGRGSKGEGTERRARSKPEVFGA